MHPKPQFSSEIVGCKDAHFPFYEELIAGSVRSGFQNHSKFPLAATNSKIAINVDKTRMLTSDEIERQNFPKKEHKKNLLNFFLFFNMIRILQNENICGTKLLSEF